MAVTFPEQFNIASYFLEDRIAEGFGDKVAVYCGNKQYTYGDVQRMANQVGNALQRLGVEMEDRVLMVLPDSIEFVAVWFGIAKIGAVITMVNTILPAADYEYYLEYTRAKVAFVDASVLERFTPAASSSPYLKHTIIVGAKISGSLEGLEGRSAIRSYGRLMMEPSDGLEMAPTTRDYMSIWLVSSG